MDINELITQAVSEQPEQAPEQTAEQPEPGQPEEESSEAQESADPDEKPAEGDSEKKESPPPRHQTLRERIKALDNPEILKDPEALSAATEELLQITRALSKQSHIVEKKERKFEKKRFEFDRTVEMFTQSRHGFLEDLKTLETAPDAKTAFVALSRLAKKDPVKFYEELSLNIATNGKRPSAQESEMKQKLEALESRLQEMTEREKHAEVKREVETAKAKLAAVASNADAYPVLAEFLQTRRGETLEVLISNIEEAHEIGEPISFAQAAEQLNAALAEALKREPKKRLDGKPAAKPVNGRSPKASTVSTRMVDQEPRRRPMTEREVIDDLASDPDVISSLGLNF